MFKMFVFLANPVSLREFESVPDYLPGLKK